MSMFELLVMLLAVLEGVFDFGVGNIIGLNIVNVLLVIGVVVIVGPVIVSWMIVCWEVPFLLFGVVAFVWVI